MEAVQVFRPRLTVVDAPRYSQIPHSVVFDNAISPGARLLYAGLQARWWKTGECHASHATLAEDFGVSERQIQRYLNELIAAKHIIERRHGRGQSKAYGPAKPPSQHDRSVVFEAPQHDNQTNMSPLEAPNTTDLSAQHDIFVRPNTTDLSPIYRQSTKKTPSEKIDKSIPEESVEREVFEYYRSKIQPSVRVNAPEKIRARLKTFSAADLMRGIDNFAADAWWMENNGARGVAWFFHSDQRSEQFLNLVPRKKSEKAVAVPKTDGAAGWRVNKF